VCSAEIPPTPQRKKEERKKGKKADSLGYRAKRRDPKRKKERKEKRLIVWATEPNGEILNHRPLSCTISLLTLHPSRSSRQTANAGAEGLGRWVLEQTQGEGKRDGWDWERTGGKAGRGEEGGGQRERERENKNKKKNFIAQII